LGLAFSQVYDLPVEIISSADLDQSAVEKLYQRNRSWDWLYGRRMPFQFSCEDRFSWGELRLELQVDRGIVSRAVVYTDAMDWSLSEKLETALTGCRFMLDDLCERVTECGIPEQEDIINLLKQQDI